MWRYDHTVTELHHGSDHVPDSFRTVNLHRFDRSLRPAVAVLVQFVLFASKKSVKCGKEIDVSAQSREFTLFTCMQK